MAGSRRSPVGVSLLAIAVCQALKRLNVKPLSRAGSLLQGSPMNQSTKKVATAFTGPLFSTAY
ncbi:hypothetical protein DBR18_19710 [Pseudomonas sp. HMWF021]|nr:hypothetical protein DBR18_19710 [Pseudomonas sp. HMWF021]